MTGHTNGPGQGPGPNAATSTSTKGATDGGTPADLLASLVGHREPGGCDYCDAQQELSEPAPGVFVLRVAHDDRCPHLALMGGPQ